MDTLEREVGKISGTLDSVVRALEESRSDVNHLTNQVNRLLVDTGNQSLKIAAMAEEIAEVKKRVDDLITLRNKFSGIAVMVVLAAGFLLDITGIPSLIHKFWSH